MKKDLLNTLRNPLVLKVKFIQSIILSLLVGGAYFSLGRDFSVSTSLTPQQSQDFITLLGFFYFISVSGLMTTLSPISIVFPKERLVFLKEESAGLYSTFAFFLSKNLIEFPVVVLIPLISTLILYWMVGLDSNAGVFFTFYLAYFLISLTGNSLGLLLGSIIPDPKIVGLLVPVLLVPFILFSGFFKNRSVLPVWIGWVEFLSPLKYVFIAFVRNELHEEEYQFLVETLNFDIELWPAIFILLGLAVGFGGLSLLFLWLRRASLQ